MQKHSKLFLLTLALLLAAQAAFAEENITELKIEDIAAEVETGAVLKFSFSAGNRIGPPCTAGIEYWVGSENVRVSEGQDSVFLGEGETKGDTSSILIPEEEMGIKGFYMQMKCNETTVMASKPIKVRVPIPVILEFSTLNILETTTDQAVKFSYSVRSNSAEILPVYIEEHILKNGTEVWASSHHSFITGNGSFNRQGPVLPAGTYTFVAHTHTMHIEDKAMLAGETSFENLLGTKLSQATIKRDFIVEDIINVMPLFTMPLLGLLAVGAAFSTGYLLHRRRGPPKQKIVPKLPPTAPQAEAIAVTQKPGKERLVQAKNYVCLIESEPSKTLNSKALNAMLEEAGFAKEEKKVIAEFAESVPVKQKVKSSVFIDRFDNPKCETSVEITVSNDSSKDWCDVVLLTKIPAFLSENISEIAADQSLQVMKDGQIVKFTIPKIEAMESASLVYSIEKWIPQDKVNLIPLPAVINYEEGQPLVVKLKSKQAETGKRKKHIAEKRKRAQRKKISKKARKHA